MYGWDHPQLVKMLEGESSAGTAAAGAPTACDRDTPMADAFTATTATGTGGGGGSEGQNAAAGAGGQGGNGGNREGVGTVVKETASLVQLRLLYLEALGNEDAYLSLAMGAKMWSEAVSSLLKSGDR